ncbi:hypothetical protein ACGFYP_07405 [Streptomyces sp. NPDC048370]|uniref:hypothetical protein n=1 Tax=Streptomyces sp. NPDC048370 TaxID=3365540 RepID=UPI003721B216
MSTTVPGSAQDPSPASGPPHRSRRRKALAVDVLVTVAAALELLTLHGQLDTTAAFVCPPALFALMLRRRFPVVVLLATIPSADGPSAHASLTHGPGND